MNESAGEQVTDLNDNLRLSSKTETDSLNAGLGGNDVDVDVDVDADVDDEVDVESAVDEERPPRPPREGLPRSFRMRHDAHYVDALMAGTTDAPVALDRDRRSRQAAEVSPAAQASEAPPQQAVTASAGPALSVIAGRLDSIVAHAGVIRQQHAAPGLIAQTVHTELTRIARLARAGAVLEDEDPPIRSTVSARDMADAVTVSSGPLARLSGVDFEVSVDDPAFTILAEPALLIQAIAGTIDAIVDLLSSDPKRPLTIDGRQPAPRISIHLQSMKVRPAIIIDVICSALVIRGALAERFFDNNPEDYGNAPAAGILLAAAAHIVRAHGGRADVKRHNGTGATITFVFPQIAL